MRLHHGVMDLEIRHLRAVCAIADTGSLTKAAGVLGLSQPALTAQLQRVERELGGPLFSRNRRGAVPTRLGEFILSRARAALGTIDDMRKGAVRHRAGSGQVIRLGGTVGSLAAGLAERLGDFLAETGADLHLQMEYAPGTLWELLETGRLDAVSFVDYQGGEAAGDTKALACAVIETEPMLVALAADHTLAGHAEIALSDLADESWALSPDDGAGWPGCFREACGRAGFTASVPYVIAGQAVIDDLVQRGQAVSARWAGAAPGDGMVLRPLAGERVERRHLVAVRRDSPLMAHLGELLHFGREAYAQLAPR